MQVVLALVEPWEDIALAWCLLPAAIRRKSAPQLAEVAPLLEDWTDIDKIATLLHASTRIETDGHLLICAIMEHWGQGHMEKAAWVVLRVVRICMHMHIHIYVCMYMGVCERLSGPLGSRSLHIHVHVHVNVNVCAFECICM